MKRSWGQLFTNIAQFLTKSEGAMGWVIHYALDIGLLIFVIYMILVIIGERQTLWMVRGFIMLMLAQVLSKELGLRFLNFALQNLVLGAAVAMAVLLQSEFRRFLELVGRGRVMELFQNRKAAPPRMNVVDEIVDAVKELSQNRTGALMILETGEPIDERDFTVAGVRLNAEVSKELIQTIFQTSTLLHDGALLIRGSRLLAASVILPVSERSAARRLGTRHRAAMGITERVENCICVVVSEETGSISLAERGALHRPLTSSKLKELLEDRLSQTMEREVVAPDFRSLSRRLSGGSLVWVSRVFRVSRPSASREKK
jgi:uncharacterized protein (TIGR00159 family)